MQEVQSLLANMQSRAENWKNAGDQRHVFLGCYSMMSQNMYDAIGMKQFVNAEWVSRLLLRFSEYYFDALAHYDKQPAIAPAVWRQVHDASLNPEISVTQNLLLGVNAHINYDLPLALYDCLVKTWRDLPEKERGLLKQDHEMVNQIIANTIDAVQDSIINPSSWSMAAIDELMGRVDEWLLSRLISSWRNEVWEVSLELLSSQAEEKRERIRKAQEKLVLTRARKFIAYL
ncbi:hypothetical protein SAMN04488057_10177 [Cyclobacterium lianum]|uniref:Uncharacterized protein n=1 Tax=Cyclobacterium lianum TaxID=388280 RepID=A0A1M7HVN5_9BACT|nr:DUF5995 family protein [Cyclobacterium lianum]SHM32478.1 hypothetical protein SAMN04488057_10177 [Cyclobacterium lianum]